jgi:hypothetical protein
VDRSESCHSSLAGVEPFIIFQESKAGRNFMGGHAYWYFVKHQPNLQRALDDLRKREFTAGRYNPAIPFLDFPIGPKSPSPGAKHSSIAKALEDSDADGTRSILDIETIGSSPDFCVAAPLDDDALEDLYGTTKPTRDMVEKNMDFFDNVERGQCVYIITYKKDDTPDEILFAGMSFD